MLPVGFSHGLSQGPQVHNHSSTLHFSKLRHGEGVSLSEATQEHKQSG